MNPNVGYSGATRVAYAVLVRDYVSSSSTYIYIACLAPTVQLMTTTAATTLLKTKGSSIAIIATTTTNTTVESTGVAPTDTATRTGDDTAMG